jgi:hypothetical protein
MALRVVQWGTGPVGKVLLHEIVRSPDLELAGVLVYNPDKAGMDAAAIIGAGDTGIVATTDKQAILALDADLVLHAASKADGFDQNNADILALLDSGKSVISTTSYIHLGVLDPALERSIQQVCQKRGVRFHGTGEHPGWVFERLAVTLTAIAQRVDRLIMRQYVNCSHLPEKRMLTDLMGMGKRPEEINDASPAFRGVCTQTEQALAAAADAMSLKFDEIRHHIEVATIDHDLELVAGTLPAGTVVGQILSFSAYKHGKPVLTCEDYWVCTNDIPQWDLKLDGHKIRIELEGIPNLSLELDVDLTPEPEFGNAPGGRIAVAMAAIRAIPEVMAASPGVVVPSPVFGAYRFGS